MSADILAQLRAGALRGITRLDLQAGLTELPPEILALSESLEILNLSNNRLTDLPDWLPELKKLRVLFCSNNPFRHVPEILGKCPALDMVGFKSCQICTVSPDALPQRLRWFILTDNVLESLPAELGRRPRLQKLMLSGNRLSSLPPELAGCHRLELLRLAANEFSAFPDWLWNLPSLAWLAVAGNPCTQLDPAADPASTAASAAQAFAFSSSNSPSTAAPSANIQAFPWTDLTLGPLLGEGASGLIHRADHPHLGPVAVKLFKGAMTSDGLPASEMAACLAVGHHPACVGALGRITGHPEDIQGLVMPLLKTGYQSLAGPPSLESCTRDIHPADAPFPDAAAALGLLTNIAGAAAHLHASRFLHGDLYAHNILCRPADSTQPALLSDFGAASSYPPGPVANIERIEVRAFGILMEEVAARLPAASGPVRERLVQWAADCQQPAVAARPCFSEIQERLLTVRG